MSDPYLPYAGTSGHSGTDTSEARAHDADTSGKTGAIQAWVLQYARDRGGSGVTVRELRESRTAQEQGWHHGNISGALTALHKAGSLERLTLTVDRCKVYVLPVHVRGRDTEPPTTRTTKPTLTPEAAELLTYLRQRHTNNAEFRTVVLRTRDLGALLDIIDRYRGK